jgi:general secretion pathway protein D
MNVIKTITPLITASLVLAACASQPERDGSQQRLLEPVARENVEVTGGELVSLDGEPVESARPSTTVEPVIHQGTGQFVNAEQANQRQPIPEDGEITLNFEGNTVQEVVATMLGELLGENYIIGPNVSGRVTFSTSRPISEDQLMPILEMLLSWNGAALVYADGRYNVLPKSEAIPGNLTPRVGSPANARGYEVRAVPLQHISATEMETILQPFARDGAIVRVDSARNLMMLAGTRTELENYLSTINTFDVDWLEGMSVGMFPLQRVDAVDVATELETIFGESAGSPLAGMFRFMPIERLNSIMVITHQPDYLSKAEEWIGRLDSSAGESSGARLFVYEVENVKAVDLADTLSSVFGGGSGSSSRSSDRDDRTGRGSVVPGEEPVSLGRIDGDNRRDSNDGNARSSGQSGGGVAIIDGEEVQITAVEESNSLLIRATSAQYDGILSAIKRLDTLPLQVLVEVRIVEVVLNDSLKYGVEWFLEQAITGNAGSPGAGAEGSSGLARGESSATIGATGLGYSFVGGDVAAILGAVETVSVTRTIAAPTLMVLNNKEAEINVGDQIPVVSSIIGVGGNGNLSTNRVQFRDTGTILSVTPRVNPGGMVFMEISQEKSDPILSRQDAQGNVPVRRRQINSEVAVMSGETVVLGGLIENTVDDQTNGLPFLHRLPVVGGLFGSKSQEDRRTELLVMITPTVVSSVAEAEAVTREYQSRFRGLKPMRRDEQTDDE